MPLARAARAADLETVITPFKINTSFNVGEHLNVAVSGAFKLKVKLVYDKEKFGADYFETELTQTLSTAITGTVTGTVGTSTLTEPATLLDVNVPIGTTPLSADVAVTFPVKADISAEGSFQARLEAGAGYRYTSVDGAQKSNSIANNDISAKIAGNFEIGAGPRLDVGVSLPGDLLSAKVSGDAMLSLHGDTDKSASALLESKHTCDCCVDGAIDLSAKIRGSLNYELCEWAKGSLAGITLFDTTMVICTFYYSAKNSEDSIFRGQPHFEANADCPNTSYPITILTRQVDGTPVTTQIEITYGNENKPKATISSGQTAWLCGGVNYRLKATIDGGPVIKTVMISGKETITLDGQGISLSGIVTEKGSNAPVANAEVTLTRGTKTLTDTTATDGRYLLNKISAGSYTLAIKKDGYRPYTAEINLTADTQHNAALEISGRRVTGSVSDENGSALSGVLVTISRDGLSKQCTTDENGAYQSDPLEAGDYTIQFTKFGYQPVTKSITVARTDMVCDATMQKASAALTVTVTDLDGKPISGAEIALYPDADPTVPAIQGTTDDAGTAAWSDLSAGTYTITAAKDGFAPYSGEVAVAADQENQQAITLQVGGSCGPTLYWKAEGTKLIIYGEGPMYNYRSSFPGGLDKAERPPWKVLDSNNTDITPYTEVEIQPGATTVGDQAFRFMSALKKAALGEGITHIGQYAFQFTSLEVPIFPSTLESMGQCAFHSVRTIRSLNLSHTRLTEIPYKCFEGASLASIKLPATLRAIGDSAFYESRGSTLVIPEGVEKIGADAFARCNFGNFSIPDTVKELGAGAFRSNEYLEEIHLPDSIEKMGSAVLSGCTNLTSVHLPGNPKLTELDSTLSACTALQQSTIPENVTTLTGTFSSCSALETVTLPQSLTTVGERAFAWCSKLKSMALPDSVTAIGKQAFFGNGTTTFTVPAGVTSIGKEAFSSTSGRMIDTITFGGTKAQWDALMTAGGDAETYYTLICSDGSYKYPETQGGSL